MAGPLYFPAFAFAQAAFCEAAMFTLIAAPILRLPPPGDRRLARVRGPG
jgi:hypothetical protein